jgi:hypothetical protein
MIMLVGGKEVATSCFNQAVVFQSQGKCAEALKLLHAKSLGIKVGVYGPHHLSVATSCNNMAVLYRRQGKEEKALAMYTMSLNIYVKEYGPDHSSVGTTYKSMAAFFKSVDARREKLNQ